MARERSSNVSERPRPRSRGGRTLLLALALAIAIGAAAWWRTTAEPAPSGDRTPPGQAIVDFVIDGDTVDLLIDGSEERVRLIGIDTPESVDPNTPEQCFGAEASIALTGLLPPGTSVDIERDAEARDRFGRLLLYVRRSDDGLFVNRFMLERGFADVSFFEPNTTYEGEFTRVRNTARADGIGLWSACDGPAQPLE